MTIHYLYALGAIFCWASLPAATGSGLAELSTPELMFYSFASAAVFLYGLDVIKSRSFRSRLPGFCPCLLGVWGIFLYHYLYYLALERAPLAEGAILATTWSLWIVVFSSILQLKRLAPSILFAAIVGFGGVGLVIAAGQELSFTSDYMLGYALALSCGLIWSSFSVSLPLLKLKFEPMTVFTILAAICSAILYILTMPHGLPSLKALASAVYLGCVPLGLSFFLWNKAISGGNLVVIGFLSYLTPPLAVLLVALIHGQQVPAQAIVGMVVIITASIAGRHFLKRQL